MKIRKTTLLLVLVIFLLGAFLRFFKIQENLLFSAEQGDNYLAIRSAISSGKLPLLGPPTSHPWLYFGPLYYWLMIPLMLIFNFHPATGTYLGVAAGSLVILLNFLVITKIFKEEVALFSSFLIAVSPLWIEFSREARHYFLVAILFYPLFWFLYKVWQGRSQFLFWVGLTLGAMLNFHLTPLVLVPPILAILWLKRKSLTKINLILGFLGFLVPNLPFLIYDLNHKFLMTIKLLAWIPYRTLGFLGFYPKNNLTPQIFKENLLAFLRFFSENFVMGQNILGILFTFVAVVFIILNFRKAFVIKKENFGWFFIFWTLGFSFLAFFIHGLPPKHYFVPVFPIPILLFSLFLERLWKGNLRKAFISIFLLIAVFLNLKFFLSSSIFYAPSEGWLLSLKFQERIVKMILEDAKGEKFNLKRVGEFDYYPGGHAQNYQYLAWWLGNKPAEEETGLRYTIYEEPQKIPEDIKEKGEVWQIDKIFILKEKK